MTRARSKPKKQPISDRTVRTTALTIELMIECRDESVAKALNDVLMPDNRYFPKDQSFKASNEGSLLRFTVESPRARPALSTVSSIVADAMLFRDVWVEAKAGGPRTPASQ